MDEKEYLEKVKEQIRYEKAKVLVSEELQQHMEDQKEAYLAEGMSEKEACENAVREMGDPVETGVALDRVHRPKLEWRMILLVAGLSLLGLLVQYVIQSDIGIEQTPHHYDYFSRQFVHVLIGFCVMLVFCFFDYTRIGRYGKVGAAVIILLLLYSFGFGDEINGQRRYMLLCRVAVKITQLVYLYIPFFGGILYSYRNQGRKGFFKSCIWMLIPFLLVLRLPALPVASSLLLVMMLQMFFAVRKGWFASYTKGMAVIGSAIVGLPILTVCYFLFFGAAYQRARILAMFDPYADSSYQSNLVRRFLLESHFVGKGTDQISTVLPDVRTEYILTYIFSYYGVLAAIALIMIFGFLVFKAVKISVKQKNQLGLIIGLGCSLVFVVQILTYIMMNLSLMPTTEVFLPFFTFGSTGTVVSFALIGILLSIYRYQNVLPEKPVMKHVRYHISKETLEM